MKNLMSVLVFVASVSFVSAADIKQPATQDSFDVALSSSEAWVRTDKDKDFTSRIAPKLVVIRQAYNETLKVEKEVVTLMSSPTKDRAWIDQALVVNKKITMLQDMLSPSSAKKEEVNSDRLVDLDEEEANKVLAEVYCLGFEHTLIVRTFNSSLTLFKEINRVFKEEDLKMGKSAKL